ncbi:MAG: hypothetical protein GY811_01115 [Myxococcales bacterium]|nr:hypothetical protein [Myxococcales bacterium]
MQQAREFASLRHTLLPFAIMATLASGACKGGPAHEDPVDAGIPDAFIPDAAIAPALFNPRDDLADDVLAEQALALMGYEADPTESTCEECHGLTRQRMRYWRAITDTSISTCFTDLDLFTEAAAKTAIDCMREEPTVPSSAYHTEAVGIFATGAHLEWFDFAFKRAYGDDYQDKYDTFKMRVGMPQGESPPFTQEQFDIVANWFTRGVPALDAELPEDSVPTECLPGVSAAVASHVTEMATTGWRAVNEQNNLLMFGCADAATSFDCLSTYPAAGDETFSRGWNVNVANQQLRVLRENGYRSNFWTRSSADGRFVANGAQSGGASSRIVDLLRDVSIPGSAFYDPAFFPDNSGFMFQQNQAYLCDQSLLVSEPEEIDYESEANCSATENVGLYQQLGRALDSSDYWAIDGQFVSDNGGRQPQSSDPRASFSEGSELRLTPLIHTGLAYEDLDTIAVTTPYEGDAVLSSTAKMVISRLRGPEAKQLGFVMREVQSTPIDNGYQVELEEVARYCFSGGKPDFSFDDRWLVVHHYIGDGDAVDLGFTGPSDPGFEEYADRGASNIYLIDTLSGAVTRITHMQPGQYALFPHFRSDGWLYFMVRTLGEGTEHIVASDAALRLEATP